MANLQYVGARYVPKFYTNPDDNSNDWKSGESYEPLTVVTYLDDSYTSKIAVPASIGNPADNSNYWVKTGNFNASITTLQTNLTNLKNKVDSVKFFASYIGIPSDTDCTSELQNFIDNSNIDTIVFNDGTYSFSNVNITRPITITSNNAKLEGTFVIDSNNVTIENCEFQGTGTIDAIQVKRCRYLTVSNCSFNTFNKVFNLLPLNGADYGSTSANDALFHKVACWNITNNKFINVNYICYQEYYTGTDDPTPMNNRRMRVSDLMFSDNIANTYNITAFSFMGVDGIQINDNVTLVNQNENSLKYFFYLQEGYYTDVKNNHIWGSGEEAIYIEWCDVTNITGNTFANCGIKHPLPVIFFKNHGTAVRAIITNNAFDQPSGDCIKIQPAKQHSVITNNTVDKQDNPIAISNDPNRVFLRTSATQNITNNNEGNLKEVYGSLNVVPTGTTPMRTFNTSHQFTTDQEEFVLADLNGTHFNGIILIQVGEGSMYGAKSAIYLCVASAMGAAGAQLPSITDVTFFETIQGVGLFRQTTAQNPSDKWCKFSFKLDQDKKLIAISENSLSTYVFRVMMLGNSVIEAYV